MLQIILNLLNIILIMSFIYMFYFTYKNHKLLDKHLINRIDLKENEFKIYKKIKWSYIVFALVIFVRFFIPWEYLIH